MLIKWAKVEGFVISSSLFLANFAVPHPAPTHLVQVSLTEE